LRKFNEQWRITSHHAVPYSASTCSLYCEDKLEVLDTLQRRSQSSFASSPTASSSASSGSRNGDSGGGGNNNSSSEKSDTRRIASSHSNASTGGSSSSSTTGSCGIVKSSSSSIVDSNGLGDSTNVWRKLHGLMQEEGSGAAAGVVTRRNSAGGVERVVDIGNVSNPAITAYEKGGIFRDSGGEEMTGSSGNMIESLVLQSAKDIFGVRFVYCLFIF